MKTAIISIDDGTLNSGAPYALFTGVGAVLPQKRFGAVRMLSPGTNTLYVGGKDILNDGTNGFSMDAGFPVFTIDLDPGDVIYGIMASGETCTVCVIYNQV